MNSFSVKKKKNFLHSLHLGNAYSEESIMGGMAEPMAVAPPTGPKLITCIPIIIIIVT